MTNNSNQKKRCDHFLKQKESSVKNKKTSGIFLCLHDLFKFAARLIILTVLFSVTGFYISSGINEFWNIYAVDSRMENNREISIGENVKLVFNQPVVFLSSKNIKITPQFDLDINLIDNSKMLILAHNKPFSSETKYEVQLENIYGISGTRIKEKKFIFYTSYAKKKNIFKTANNNKNIFAEFELSKNKYFPPPVSIPKMEVAIEPKIKEGKYIDISVSNQVMTIFDDGLKINSFLISTGKYGMPTPLGMFSVKKKEDNHWSSTYGLWMPYSMNFYSSFYIHELPYWPSGYREGESHLGVRVSHGCIRLGIGPAKYVYDWSEIGTPVYVHK